MIPSFQKKMKSKKENKNKIHLVPSTMSTDLFTQQNVMFDSSSREDNFGILHLQASLSNLTKQELELFFQIDCSGSMQDVCSDCRTKMQHILHTLKNMVIFLKENPSLNVHITIHAFDDQIYKVVDRTPVNEDTCDKILAAIQKIYPRDSTNIENALKDVSEYFTTTDLPSNSEKVNIFMTDGQANSGSIDQTTLREYVNETITNIFIGFGLDHDAKLLKTISSGEKSSYYFIDKLENAGLVYGEILHGIVYKFLENVAISITNGVIYDYKTNTWNSTLHVGNIASEGSKFYQITSKDPANCAVELTGMKVCDGSNFTLHVSIQEERMDLTNYMYRQRTQEMLFKVNEYNIKEDSSTKEYIEKQKDRKIIRKELHDLFEELKKYMSDNQLNDNIMLKNLCDDIYICYKTFGSNYGFMYCTARESSQGQQRAYTATQLPEDTEQTDSPTIFRGGIRRNFPNIPNTDQEEDVLQHNISDCTHTPYRTGTITNIMRSCSER